MALDTKYRPRTYGDVLGQDATVAVLRQFVKEGRGLHQSYVFCGQHGSGKTTLGRLLARSLLCEAPVEGASCDSCGSCRVLLDGGTHECFEELDAATKSGKADLARIVEDVTYSTYSGKRRIYLFDESHRLSKQALDVLLKPMEDNVLGSEEKRLVCIFCTTEPAKMASTIFSRCAPAFVIRPAPLPEIVERLTHVCGQEGIEYEGDALTLLVEQSESHIRDALKMVEGVSMLGGITRTNAAAYLHLEANEEVLGLLEALGSDLNRVVSVATSLSERMSPSGAYERVAEAAMLVYRVYLGVASIPTKWDGGRVKALAESGPSLLTVASRFAAPPHRPTRQTLILDSVASHHLYGSDVGVSVGAQIVVSAPAPPVAAPPTPPLVSGACSALSEGSSPDLDPVGNVGHGSDTPTASTTANGIWVDSRAVGHGPVSRTDKSQPTSDKESLSSPVFRELVRHHLRRMMGDHGRSG